MFTEFDRTKHDFELHVFEGDHTSLDRNLKNLGVVDSDSIQAFDVELVDGKPTAVERPSNVAQFKNWAVQNIGSIRNTYCVMRFSFNSIVTGWVLYRFYDLTYLTPSSVIAGALMGGSLSLLFMVHTIKIDNWILKSKNLFGQFARSTLLSVIYMAVIKATYLGFESVNSGVTILTAELLKLEAVAIFKGLMGSSAQMFFSFWNAYRKENRDAGINGSNLPVDEKHIELQFQRVLSKSGSLVNSIVNNTLSLLMNVSHNTYLDAVGYAVTTAGGLLFVKEYRNRATRIKSCGVALGNIQ